MEEEASFFCGVDEGVMVEPVDDVLLIESLDGVIGATCSGESFGDVGDGFLPKTVFVYDLVP